MARAPRPNDFPLTVDGVGTFVFARKAMREQIEIETEFAKLTGGLEDIPPHLAVISGAMAALKVLTVESPNGWDAYLLDPEDSASYEQIMKVWSALRDKLVTFRKTVSHGSEEKG